MSDTLDALDPELRPFVEGISTESRRLAQDRVLDWPKQREIAERVRAAWRTGGPTMASVHDHCIDSSAGNFRLRLMRPQAAIGAVPVLVYVHGGGWCCFSIDTHDRLMREYAEAAGVAVVAVDYALAPEHPYPAALEQCVEAVAWIRGNAYALQLDPNHLALGGDSAGANLALASALRLRDQGMLSGVCALLLNYGAFDPDISVEAAAALGGANDMLTAPEMHAYWDAYLGADRASRGEPTAVPARAVLSGLPPSLLVCGDRDLLAEQSAAMAERMRVAGVDVTTRVYPGAPHSFLEAMSISFQARDAIASSSAWLRGTLFEGTADVAAT